MASGSNPPPRGGLSLYANLLGQSAPGTISSAPVLYKQPGGDDAQKQDEKKKVNSAALLFQPTKRPQIASQKGRAKTTFPRPSSIPTNSSSPDSAAKSAAQATGPAVKTTLADWTADDDDVNGFYAGEQRPRGSRKKKKKKFQEEAPVFHDWNALYDPAKPNSYMDYKTSDARIREIRAWKQRLYAHRVDSSEDDNFVRKVDPRFAPPQKYSFAPPSNLTNSPFDYSPVPPVSISDAATGEDAYAQRMRLSQITQQPPPLPSPPPPPSSDIPLPPSDPSPPLPAPPQSSVTISRAPVRYNLPAPSSDIPASETDLEEVLAEEDSTAASLPKDDTQADAPRSNRPGQANFAERYLKKFGHVKGKGLGANQSGIINPLQVHVQKRKKLPDAEGGGYADRGGKGKIVGGKKAKGTEEKEGKHGAMSDVIITWGMVNGLDLEQEMHRTDGGIRQEIGEACSASYGNVERVFVHEHSTADSIPVFVKFTNPLSALRAVNALDDSDFKFNGNPVRARFYDSEKFEQGIYE
ncbi:hypothetical protein K432DRAFT_294667 [Lepidopterella palustris CBS 459.81]|uniref:G-patch domain-containing protein n=1 Tax=Lepidopterella palustris CBS 459.81 TaxID=1314670 RepID=A0A8E2EDL9_9PEZI|nr:hypothetical protein K432DRAFT_294667 [Lepidopterella palustris CBS 459.81]